MPQPKKQDILNRINEVIEDEKGIPVTMQNMFADAELDSLGTILTIAALEEYYPIFQNIPNDEDAIASLDLPNLTIRDLVNKCKSSIIISLKELKTGTVT